MFRPLNQSHKNASMQTSVVCDYTSNKYDVIMYSNISHIPLDFCCTPIGQKSQWAYTILTHKVARLDTRVENALK